MSAEILSFTQEEFDAAVKAEAERLVAEQLAERDQDWQDRIAHAVDAVKSHWAPWQALNPQLNDLFRAAN